MQSGNAALASYLIALRSLAVKVATALRRLHLAAAQSHCLKDSLVSNHWLDVRLLSGALAITGGVKLILVD